MPPDVPPSDPRIIDSRRTAALAFAVFLASFAFFASNLSGREPTLMESQDLDIAHRLTWPKALPIDQSPIYYKFLKFWLHFHGTPISNPRLPSAILVAMGAAALFLLGRKSIGLAGGLAAALIFTTNAVVLENARLARAYPVVLMFACVSMLFGAQYVTYRRARDLLGFLAATVAGIYTHFFFLLFAGSLGLVVIADLVAHFRSRRPRWWFFAMGAAAMLAIVPQLLRVEKAIRYSEARHGLYGGMSAEPLAFFKQLGADYFLLGTKNPVAPEWVLIALAAAMVMGAIALRWRGTIALVLLAGPTLFAGWHLSKTNPMHTRYVLFLLPVFAFFLAAVLRARPRWVIGVPIVAGILAVNALALAKKLDEPNTDWGDAAAYVREMQRAGDVVAVFPHHWDLTFREFYEGDTTDFTFVEQLDRVFARGRRVILVQGPGRPFDNVGRFMRKRARVTGSFGTKQRFRIQVHILEPHPADPVAITDLGAPSMLFGGIVGSGGYGWQLAPEPENPFAGLSDLIGAADMTIFAYMPLRPPKPLRDMVGRPLYRALGNRSQVIDFLREAGVDALAPVPMISRRVRPGVSAIGGIDAVPVNATWRDAAARVFDVAGTKVGVLYSRQQVFSDKPQYKRQRDATIAEFEGAVARARTVAGENGRLVVLLPQPPDFDMLFTPEDQYLARRAIDLGADAAIGLGGFASKEIEEYRDGVIAHGLGTLVRPRAMAGADRYSTGLLLRLAFGGREGAAYQAIPVTFDDAERPIPADREAARNVVYAQSSAARERLADGLLYARAGYETKGGERRDIKRWRSAPSMKHVPAKIEDWLPGGGAGYVVHDRWAEGGAAVGAEGIVSHGIFRRALTLAPGEHGAVSVTFPKVLLGETIELAFGVADKTFTARARRLKVQHLRVQIGEKVRFRRKVEHLSGWQDVSVHTGDLAGTTQDVTFVLETREKSRFAVAIDPVAVRGPETLAKIAEMPFAFEEHLSEARVFVRDRGRDAPCHGPDETHRYLYGGPHRAEEHGPFGEGLLRTRWVCGAMPWDSAARTVQKAGGELRRAIWLHPPDAGERHIVYGPMTARRRIHGHVALTDLALKKNKLPVTFSILVNGTPILVKTAGDTPGWLPFEASIPDELRGQDVEIAFVASAQKATWRHLVFDAVMD
ncbi:glycosyltransferase family 39 protein [bacterium]|nr:glycosyltransferase family 39 protein [bacterium]